MIWIHLISLFLSEIYMVPSVVKESSGLFTVTSTLYIQPEKIDAKSVFHCTAEYSMPNGDIKKENSEPFNLTLLCESHACACIVHFLSLWCSPWPRSSTSFCFPPTRPSRERVLQIVEHVTDQRGRWCSDEMWDGWEPSASVWVHQRCEGWFSTKCPMLLRMGCPFLDTRSLSLFHAGKDTSKWDGIVYSAQCHSQWLWYLHVWSTGLWCR